MTKMINETIESRKEEIEAQMNAQERRIWAYAQSFYEAAQKNGKEQEGFRFFREHFALHILLVWMYAMPIFRSAACAFHKANSAYESGVYMDSLTIAVMALFHDFGMGWRGPDAKTIRKRHAINSALAVCRKDSYEFLQTLGICPEWVAMGCLLHSKSCSGVRDLSSRKQYLAAVAMLDGEVEQLTREGGEYRFNKMLAILAARQICSMAAVIRMADSAAHDADSAIMMNGEAVVIIGDRAFVGGVEAVKDVDRKYVFGEINIRRMWISVEEGVVVFHAVLVNPAWHPYETIEVLKERIDEMMTICGAFGAMRFCITSEGQVEPGDWDLYKDWAEQMRGFPIEVGP